MAAAAAAAELLWLLLELNPSLLSAAVCLSLPPSLRPSPAVSLACGQSGGCLGHCVSNVLGQGLSGVTNTQADDLCIWVSLLVGTTTPGNLLCWLWQQQSVVVVTVQCVTVVLLVHGAQHTMHATATNCCRCSELGGDPHHLRTHLWEQVASLQLAKVLVPGDLEHSCCVIGDNGSQQKHIQAGRQTRCECQFRRGECVPRA